MFINFSRQLKKKVLLVKECYLTLQSPELAKTTIALLATGAQNYFYNAPLIQSNTFGTASHSLPSP